jgi:hypothetical protein
MLSINKNRLSRRFATLSKALKRVEKAPWFGKKCLVHRSQQAPPYGALNDAQTGHFSTPRKWRSVGAARVALLLAGHSRRAATVRAHVRRHAGRRSSPRFHSRPHTVHAVIALRAPARDTVGEAWRRWSGWRCPRYSHRRWARGRRWNSSRLRGGRRPRTLQVLEGA